MKPIRPLFHNSSRFGTPQCHETFKAWVGDPLRGQSRTPPDKGRGTLQVQRVKRPDGRGHRIVLSPVAAYTTVPGIIAAGRKRGCLRPKEVEFLRRFMIKTVFEETYRQWLRESRLADYFLESDWDDEENQRKFALYAMACFVDFLRPGLIDWRTPNAMDLQRVGKLLDEFARLPSPEEQRALIRKLFDPFKNLHTVIADAEECRQEKPRKLSRQDKNLLVECLRLRLRGPGRAKWLAEKGFRGFGKSPLERYEEARDSMRAQLNRWTREAIEEE